MNNNFFTEFILNTNVFLLGALMLTLGMLVLYIAWLIQGHRINRINEMLIKAGMEEIDRMQGFEFEEYLAVLFKNLGYKVRVTKATGDFGADLILKEGNKKIIVQAKRYSKKVGVRAVQEISAAINYYQANEAFVVTNNYFTDPAFKLAEINNVRLIDREGLAEMIVELKGENEQIAAAEGNTRMARRRSSKK